MWAGRAAAAGGGGRQAVGRRAARRAALMKPGSTWPDSLPLLLERWIAMLPGAALAPHRARVGSRRAGQGEPSRLAMRRRKNVQKGGEWERRHCRCHRRRALPPPAGRSREHHPCISASRKLCSDKSFAISARAIPRGRSCPPRGGDSSQWAAGLAVAEAAQFELLISGRSSAAQQSAVTASARAPTSAERGGGRSRWAEPQQHRFNPHGTPTRRHTHAQHPCRWATRSA